MINEGIFMEIEIHVREGEIVATDSERGNSADVTLWRKEVMKAVSFTEYQTFVSSGNKLFSVKRRVAQTEGCTVAKRLIGSGCRLGW